MKIKTTYICNECGYQTQKWLGKCPGCNAWGSLEETEIEEKKQVTAKKTTTGGEVRRPKKLDEIQYDDRMKNSN